MSDIFISLKGKITGTVTGKGKMFGASWFLLALFFVQTECDIILQLKKNIPVIIILIGLFILLLLLKHVTFNINFIHCDNNHSFHFPNLFNLKNSLMALPFFLAGFLFKEYKIIDTVIDYIKNRSIQYNTIQYNTIQYNTDSTCIPSTGRIFDWRIFQQTCIGI
jgi:hypothetical protein